MSKGPNWEDKSGGSGRMPRRGDLSGSHWEPGDEDEELPPPSSRAERSSSRSASRPGARPADRGADRSGRFEQMRDQGDNLRDRSAKAKGGLFAGKKNKPAVAKGPLKTRFKDWLAQRRTQWVVQPENIELGRRLMALGIDFGAAFLLGTTVQIIPLVNKFFLSQNIIMLALMCCRDYFFGGRGLGKNIMGLRVVDIFNGQAPTLKAVLTRNLFYLGPILFFQVLQWLLGIIPLGALSLVIGQTGLAIATLYTLVILPIECYRTWQRDDSMRLGDEIAGTCIVESDTDFSEFIPKQ